MPAPQAEHEPQGGQLGAAISNAVVRLMAEYTGRGPTKARTSIRDNVVLVVLQDTLTKGERALVRNGRQEKVIDLRGEFQAAMRDEVETAIEELTGRRAPAAELFILDGGPPFDKPAIEAVDER